MNQLIDDGSRGAGHVDIERMLAVAHGESGRDEAAAVLRHGLACRQCGDELAVMLALTGAWVQYATPGDRAATSEVRGGTPVTSHWPGWTGALAAAVVFALLLGAALSVGIFQPAGEGGEVGRSPVVEGPAAPEGAPGSTATTDPAIAPAELARLRQLATDVPPGRVMLDFLFEPDSRVARRQSARSGLALVVTRRYDEAVAHLTPMHAARPSDGETAAALGIALYLSGDDGERVADLLRQGRALRAQDFSNLSAWYLANLYLRRGDVVQARGVLQELAQWPDLPGEQARELLGQLRSEEGR